MPKKKKKAKPSARKNPADPNLLARSILEAAIGEPLTTKSKKSSRLKPKP